MRLRFLLFACGLFVIIGEMLADTPREVTFLTQDSVTIYGTLYTPETNEMSPGLILLHMLKHKRKDWDTFAQQAAKAGFTVLTIDLRGHGQSVKRGSLTLDVQRFSNAEFAEMVKDVRAAVGLLGAQKGVDRNRISIVGASIGANLALQYAATDSTIRSLVLLSPGLNYRGLTTEDAMKIYKLRPVFLVAARDDDYASDSVEKLASLVEGSMKKQIYEKAGHGTYMFETVPELKELILEWVEKTGK